ncbi:MAG: hypothetical protein WD185_07960, partial [Sneathiella sp.]
PESSHLAEMLEKRARANQQYIDNSTKPVSEPAKDDGFSVGARIFHQKFGYGRIVRKDGPKLEITFEKAGVKKVMENFVQSA